MSKAGWPLQKAIFAALGGNANIQTLIGTPARIYDDVPGGVALPYVQIGEGSEADWSTASGAGSEHQLTIHAWSRAGGRKEARAILAAIYDVLHEATLTLEGQRLVNLRFVISQIFRDGDGETYHGVARYRAVTEPA